MVQSDVWLRCSACKQDIRFGAAHWVCSVSTCNRNRMRLVFCSVPCWDSHVAMLRHRDAWAVEARAPSKEAWEREVAEQKEEAASAAASAAPAVPAAPAAAPAIRRHVVNEPPKGGPPPASFQGAGPALAETEREILIVVSKLKKYIKDRSGFNTSDAVAEVLSDHVRAICDQAIRTAATDGRKTVLDRDVPKPRSSS
jgi:hypothetical protein